jgi:hypothetical protein
MFRLLVVLLFIPLASGETWQDAIRARDYERAAQLLHPIVGAADDYTLHGQDPMPARQLAVMYAQGLGVPRDPIGACALAITARFPVENSAPRFAQDVAAWEANREQATKFVDQHCAGLLPQDLAKATTAVGCFAFAMPEEVFTIGKRRVRVGRSGIGLEDARDHKIMSLVQCPLFIARVRATTIPAPADAGPEVVPRHVVEVFAWMAGRDPKTMARTYGLSGTPTNSPGATCR